MSEDRLLFYKGDLNPTLNGLQSGIVQEINDLKPDYLLQVSENDLIASMKARSAIEPLELFHDKIIVEEPREIDITLTGEQAFMYATKNVTLRGTEITVIVPFRGNPLLFKLHPPTWSPDYPQGKVVGQELHLAFSGVNLNEQQLKKEYERTLASIEKNIERQRESINLFNDRLETIIHNAISTRKAKLLKDRHLVSVLNIPIRHRNMPQTYAVPSVRRKPSIELPKASSQPFKPEPTLKTEDYEFILKVIQDMTLVMERSPHAFANMREEDLRTQILVQLNGHYEGVATGETFNFQGKTDILIRHENSNVFIAECKFWRGDKSFTETIDQLLGYASWRDTKTAILIFNRNKDTSKVLEKIPGLVKAHPNHKRELARPGETQFQHVLHHKGDTNREIILTVMVFDVPGDEVFSKGGNG